MKFVKSILKVWPEIMVLLSSMSYIIIRLVADMNKVSLPTWFNSFNIPWIEIILQLEKIIVDLTTFLAPRILSEGLFLYLGGKKGAKLFKKSFSSLCPVY